MSNSTPSKVIRKIIRKLTNKFELFNIYPPYDFVQTVNEQSIHAYLKIEKSEIMNWVIVGGYLGFEVPRILNNYPNCYITIFECSNRYIKGLQEKYGNNPRVKIIEKAVSDEVGTITFYETNLRGSGSLLKIGELSANSYGMEQAEQFTVETITLDEIFKGKTIDVLQLDVQGAELKVLNGARGSLINTKAVFTEVSIRPNLYEGSVILDEIYKTLLVFGFCLCLLGTDYNLTGNALFIKSKK